MGFVKRQRGANTYKSQLRRCTGLYISDIVPYARNARRNEAAIPVVADSIREFGLRGQILLESRERPVIVTGHTRVAACKRLGWTEIPDEHIAFCDGMTEEQIRAFRIADNKTAEVAKWNVGMLKSEVRAIGKVDMAKFGCDFSKVARSYGAERLRTDDAYNLDICSRSDCRRSGMPGLRGRMAKPRELAGFNYAKTMPEAEKADRGCHFFIDDYQFERVWSRPRAYLDALRGFACVLTPDFSLYMDMPDPMQRWNVYRSRALGALWQREGLCVVPTLTWAQPETYAYAFDGLPRRSTVAVSTVGAKGDPEALAVWRDGMREAMRRLEPRRVLLYGGRVDFDFGGCEVVEYANGVTERMGHGR